MRKNERTRREVSVRRTLEILASVKTISPYDTSLEAVNTRKASRIIANSMVRESRIAATNSYPSPKSDYILLSGCHDGFGFKPERFYL